MNYLIFPLLLLFSVVTSAEVFQGHCRHRPPILQVNDDQCSGPFVDMVESALARLGHKIEWQAVPWARSLELAKRGEVDLLPYHSMNKDRANYLSAIEYGHRMQNIYFYTHQDNNNVVNSFDDLAEFRIGALRGSAYYSAFDKNDRLDKWFVTKAEQLRDMLEVKRIDLAIISELHGTEIFEHSHLLKKVGYKESDILPRHFSIPKTSPMNKYAKQINQVIQNMRATNEINRFYEAFEMLGPLQNLNQDPLYSIR